MCKDEADVAAGMLTHLADEVDHIIVADNGSTDGTREILADLRCTLPLTVIDDPDPAYFQSQKMTNLANLAAAEFGADWILPVDFDELWVWNGDTIRNELKACRGNVVRARLFNHFPTAVDVDDPDPFRSIVWRQPEPAPLPKVAFRWHRGSVIHQGNHGVSIPDKTQTVDGLEIRHFPYRTAEQFVTKARNGAAAYKATDLPENIGSHWRSYGDILERHGEDVLISEVFRRWFYAVSPVDMGWVNDPAPYRRWQSQS